MTTWILTICIGVSSWGCGGGGVVVYPSEDSCYRALREMKTGDQAIAESGLKRNTVAWCAPKEQKEGKK